MEVKNERISKSFISQLSDWEILSAFTYCNKIIKRETYEFQQEFEMVCFFFFDGDAELTIKILEEVKSRYIDEYSKRHSN